MLRDLRGRVRMPLRGRSRSRGLRRGCLGRPSTTVPRTSATSWRHSQRARYEPSPRSRVASLVCSWRRFAITSRTTSRQAPRRCSLQFVRLRLHRGAVEWRHALREPLVDLGEQDQPGIPGRTARDPHRARGRGELCPRVPASPEGARVQARRRSRCRDQAHGGGVARERITTAIARMPDSEALYRQAADEESEVKRLRSELRNRAKDVPRIPP